MEEIIVFQGKEYVIKVVGREVVGPYITEHHYLHKCPVTSFNVVTYSGDQIVAAICFGPPAYPTIPPSIVVGMQNDHCLELQRLFASDELGKNFESYFIGQSLRWLRKTHPKVEVIISFADPSEGHVGTVYQATNWIYTGLTSVSVSNIDPVTNKSVHNRTKSKRKLTDPTLFDSLIRLTSKPKHRYLMPLKKKTAAYRNVETNEFYPHFQIDILLDREQKMGREFLERHEGELKVYFKPLVNFFKRKVVPYPKRNSDVEKSSSSIS